MKNNQKSAFTLAEVLITLAIIGVVAALTIPTVVRNYQEAQYKAAAKKAFTTVANVTNMVMMDNGGTMKTDISGDYAVLSKYYKDLYKKHISYIKECDNITECAQIGAWHKSGEWYSHLNTPILASSGGFLYHAGLVAKDGMFWRIYFYSPSCTYSVGRCGSIYIDTNGAKKPNTLGKDIFIFNVFANKVTIEETFIYAD